MRSYDRLILNAAREQRAGQRLARQDAGTPVPAIPPVEFTSDVDVLNYALALEHLEAELYTLVNQFQFGQDAFGNSIDDWLVLAGEQEEIHVETLSTLIQQLGGTPVEAANYDFGVTDAQSFLNLAATVENLGVSAYDGAASFISSQDLLTAAGTIVAVEARHASYLNLLTQLFPWPGAFENPIPPAEVLATASEFILPGT